ncbi:MAG: LPS export ABC transporter protein LptC [Saprospiraceae bacterium]|jgi:LPS export ABC transporter protein LptC
MFRTVYLLIFLSILVASCDPDTKGLKSLEITEPIPDAIYYNYEIFYSDSGLTKVKIAGRVLEQHSSKEGSDGNDHMKDSVHLWFYDSDMKVQSEMIADRAIRNRKTGYMEAFGEVIVYNEKGEKLETEHLIWDEQKEKIISNTEVTIRQKTQTIVGDGLISDQNFLDYEIKNPHGELFIDNEDKQ